jgi:hypothetical protein
VFRFALHYGPSKQSLRRPPPYPARRHLDPLKWCPQLTPRPRCLPCAPPAPPAPPRPPVEVGTSPHPTHRAPRTTQRQLNSRATIVVDSHKFCEESAVERYARRDEARRPERIADSALWWYETRCYGYTRATLRTLSHVTPLQRAAPSSARSTIHEYMLVCLLPRRYLLPICSRELPT